MHCKQLLLFQLLVQELQLKFSINLEIMHQQEVHFNVILEENSSLFLFHKIQFHVLSAAAGHTHAAARARHQRSAPPGAASFSPGLAGTPAHGSPHRGYF